MLYIHDIVDFETTNVRLVTPRAQIHIQHDMLHLEVFRRRGGCLGLGMLQGIAGFVARRRNGNWFPRTLQFFLDFSEGNDLRYISKGFFLAGKRVRHRYPPTRTSRLLHRLPLLQGLPDNLHFSTINLTFVQFFLPRNSAAQTPTPSCSVSSE